MNNFKNSKRFITDIALVYWSVKKILECSDSGEGNSAMVYCASTFWHTPILAKRAWILESAVNS